MAAREAGQGPLRLSWSLGVRVELHFRREQPSIFPAQNQNCTSSDACIAVSTYFFISFGFPLNFSVKFFKKKIIISTMIQLS